MAIPSLSLIVLAIIGILLSLYALYVEQKKKRNKKYRPFCDFNKHMSCTKAFTSAYGHLLGLPNAAFGILFSLMIIVTSFINAPYIVILAGLGVLATIILAYLSYYRLKDFCLVCTATYVVNVAIALIAFKEAFVG